ALFHPLCLGLAEVHSNDIEHRDMKPANVIILEGFKPVITDFGIAAARAADTRLTMPGFMLGTPAYMSPEQARGDPDISSASDVFSLGMMMFESLTGRLPQNSENALEQINRRVSEDMPLVSAYNRDVPEPLVRLAARALNRNPLKRPHSCKEMAAELKEAYDLIFPSRETGLAPEVDLSRTLSLPRDETQAIADGVDINYADLFALISAVEQSQTGYGLLVIHYPSDVDILLFAEDALTRAFSWSDAGVEETEFRDVLDRHEAAAEGSIDALVISEQYFKAVKAALSGKPDMSGMRAAFVDFLALFDHLLNTRESGVIKIELGGKIGLIVVQDGMLTKMLCSPWFGAGRQGVAPLADALASHGDTLIEFHAYSPAAPTSAGPMATEPLIDPQALETLVRFVAEALHRSGTALEKQFGIGTRPILEKHLRIAAAEYPAVLEGLELSNTHSLSPADLRARIESLPHTGRSFLALSALVRLLETRADAIRDALPQPRKYRKVVKEYLSVWSTVSGGLEAMAIAQPFEELFAGLQSRS
ncbi:MAG: serine/threonine protein kinase, partial [Deltaproteobacteria bacterium]|nr:serine/threonine protein kinase [Deltaproteobacteria bacterium]